MRIKNFILVITIALFSFNCIYGQYIKVEEEIEFQSRIDNPVKTEVLEQGDKYTFYAINRSFYPYQIKINFNELKNLTPTIFSRDFIVLQGRNRLFSLTVKDKESGHSYRYSFSYTIGVPSKNIDFKYPYLIPLGKNKSFELVKHDESTYIIDFFKINQGDTIYSMRKGAVVAVPDMFHNADRISQNKSLEIMHKDGTIMLYENMDPDRIFVKPGTTVFPDQPLGIVNNTSILEVYLYMIQKDNKLKPLNINYYIMPDRVEGFSDNLKNINIVHPKEIITKEMTKSEIKNQK